MVAVRRLRIVILLIIFVAIILCYFSVGDSAPGPYKRPGTPGFFNFIRRKWRKLPDRFPVDSYIALPTGVPTQVPRIQAEPPNESQAAKEERLRRREAVKKTFVHSWNGYTTYAWLHDEVSPVSASWKDTFSGWAASLVDALDSLWILGLREEFEIAIAALPQIDFSKPNSKSINVFETTIRYLGGLLAAYDISERQYPILLAKAIEIGDLLMSAFDTQNRMPNTQFEWKEYMFGWTQSASQTMLVSEIGSLSLEFTRLTQLTGDLKYYDAVQRIANEFERSQNSTRLPGMWPVIIDASVPSFDRDTLFTLGGMSDSLYEYFPKQYLLLGGLLPQPCSLYENFIEVAKKHMFFRFYNPDDLELLLSGDIRIRGPNNLTEPQPRVQHLGCFTGGMVGLAARLFKRPQDLKIAEQLTSGCVWAYNSFPHGVSPEVFRVMPCPSDGECKWSQEKWLEALKKTHLTDSRMSDEMKTEVANKIIKEDRLPPGVIQIHDSRYILRPEAIESVFYMYRITGSQHWADTAWQMFQAVDKISRTPVAAAAVLDVTQADPVKMDSMESFWLAETLKYFYLCFEEFDVVSLDEWVLNTEAHPLRRPKEAT
ncbi:glycoside hydrolase [Xylogone sp. PMI_703]|nr:glycoside hydrolase [Xylogone sp. PMI_703]